MPAYCHPFNGSNSHENHESKSFNCHLNLKTKTKKINNDIQKLNCVSDFTLFNHLCLCVRVRVCGRNRIERGQLVQLVWMILAKQKKKAMRTKINECISMLLIFFIINFKILFIMRNHFDIYIKVSKNAFKRIKFDSIEKSDGPAIKNNEMCNIENYKNSKKFRAN